MNARHLAVPVTAGVLALVLWDSFIVYPFKIFVVFLHELSHGLAAVATGGSIERIELSVEQGGLCVTRGGWSFLISSAGYLGSLAWGAFLLVVASRSRLDRPIVALMGLSTLAVTLLYLRSLFGFAYGLLAGTLLLAVAAFLPSLASDLLLKVVGVVSCLYAIWDILSDVLLREVPGSDAHALGEMTGIPASFWGVLWAGIAMAVTGYALSLASVGQEKQH